MMRKVISISVILCFYYPLDGQTYKSQIAHPICRYKMSAELDTEAKTVKGHYVLTWWNHTSDHIPDLYFHLYLNAYKNLDSTFMREATSDATSGFEEWAQKPEKERWGWVDLTKIQIDAADLTGSRTFVHPDDANNADETVMRVALPRPIPPQGTIEVTVDFVAKLPRVFFRTGYDNDYFVVTQWFPKIGVYEGVGDRGRKQGGWNCHQFHTSTEFYPDFGVYDVELTAPSRYVVGATGFLRNKRTDGERAIYNYYQEDVPDFAWTASPRFLKITRKFEWQHEVKPVELTTWSKVLGLPEEEIALRDVDVTLLLQPDQQQNEDRYFRAAFNGIKYYGLWYGKYPFETLTLVNSQRNSNTGGMEYPTFVTVGASYWPGSYSLDPEMVTIHEFGHNFWAIMVSNNEFEEAWLDEGFNTYSTRKVLAAAYGSRYHYDHILEIPIPALPWLSVRTPSFPFAGLGGIPMGSYFSYIEEHEGLASRRPYLEQAKDDELVRNGWEYLNSSSYIVNSYNRPALVMQTLENYLGFETMARVMRTYHQRWRFRHPAMQDFVDTVNEVSGRNMDWFFQQFFYSSNVADYTVASVDVRPVTGKVGMYDENSKKVLHTGQKPPAPEKDRLYRSTVLVQRLGEVIAPVDVLVRFDNGSTAREHWDGRYRWVRYTYERPSKAVSAEVDPDHKITLDANFTNNSWVVKRDRRAAVQWYARWIFWLQNLFFAAGFFS